MDLILSSRILKDCALSWPLGQQESRPEPQEQWRWNQQDPGLRHWKVTQIGGLVP